MSKTVQVSENPDTSLLSEYPDASEAAKRIIANLLRLGTLRRSMLSSVIVGEHYVLYTEHGPLDIILEDLTKEINS